MTLIENTEITAEVLKEADGSVSSQYTSSPAPLQADSISAAAAAARIDFIILYLLSFIL